MTTTTPNHDSPRIILFAWSIPHYRAAVYRRLCQNPHIHFTICAGDNPQTFDSASLASGSDVGNLEGVRWRRLASRRLSFWPLRGYEWQPEAVRIAWREPIDAVITFGNKSVSNWLVRIVARIRRIPLLEWSIGVMRPERGLKWALRKFYMRQADALLLYGSFARDFFASRGFAPERLFVVHNSLDHDQQVAIRESLTPEQIEETRRRFGVAAAEDRLIFHSGRLEPKKNLPLLLDALRILRDRARRIVLVLIGTGHDETSLRGHSRRSGLEGQVVFYGTCYDEVALARIISAADLCVVPGVTGLIAMHSLVYGTPVLTRDNRAGLHGPEVEAVVEGATGGYFRADDVNDLARRMESMLYPSPCKPRMSAACMRAIDEHYTPAHQERILLEALNSVLPLHRRLSEPPA